MILFNLSQFSSKQDPKFKEAEIMMQEVIRDSIHIHYSDSTWYAIAHCKGVLDGKSVNFDIYLNVQHRSANMYKWVINKVKGKIFDISPKKSNENIMLYPDDHETNFLSLRRMTSEQPSNIELFMSRDFNYDSTSAFCHLIFNKRLKIEYVDDLEFVFTQIPGYIFHVKYFERENSNAGWLISDFYKNDEKKQETDENKNLKQPDYSIQQMKAVYERRLKEKISQLGDYLSFIQKEDTLRVKSVYIPKLKSLFYDNAKVVIKDKDDYSNRSTTIEDFCNSLCNKLIKVNNVDSVMVPVWEEQLIDLKPTINRIMLPACKIACIASDNANSNIKINKSLLLPIYREDTEDGVEWLPLFGDIVVSAM